MKIEVDAERLDTLINWALGKDENCAGCLAERNDCAKHQGAYCDTGCADAWLFYLTHTNWAE